MGQMSLKVVHIKGQTSNLEFGTVKFAQTNKKIIECVFNQKKKNIIVFVMSD